MSSSSEPTPTPTSSGSSLRASIDNPYAVLALLFCVTGFLGLPVLWMSRGFTPAMKCVWSVVVTVYTLLLIGCTLGILWWAYATVFQAI